MALMIPLWIATAMLANACIIATEFLNRNHSGTWLTVLPTTAPLIIVAQFALFWTWNTAPSWYAAWIVFTVGNSLTRAAAIASTSSAGEIASWPTVVLGVSIMLTGSAVLKLGIR